MNENEFIFLKSKIINFIDNHVPFLCNYLFLHTIICSAGFWSRGDACDLVFVVKDDHNNNKAYVGVTIGFEHFLVSLKPIVTQNGQLGQHHHDQDR